MTSRDDALNEVIASLKKQIAAIESDDDCFWPACILGTDEAQRLVDALAPAPPSDERAVELLRRVADYVDDETTGPWPAVHKYLASVVNDTGALDYKELYELERAARDENVAGWKARAEKAEALLSETERSAPPLASEAGKNLYALAQLIMRLPEGIDDDERVLAVLQRANTLAGKLDKLERAADGGTAKVPDGWAEALVRYNDNARSFFQIANRIATELGTHALQTNFAAFSEKTEKMLKDTHELTNQARAMLAAAPSPDRQEEHMKLRFP